MRAASRPIAIALIGATTIILANSASAQDATAGQTAFKACNACHAIDKSKRMGPGLAGIVGRESGSMEGFRYSKAMKSAHIMWDEKNLDAFLAAPQKFMPGNTMPFAGIPNPETRSNVIAYLKTLK